MVDLSRRSTFGSGIYDSNYYHLVHYIPFVLTGFESQELQLNLFLLLVLISITIYSSFFLLGFSFAQSPFAYQEVRDGYSDWKDSLFRNASGVPQTDILSVNIFSDGKLLNATLWLSDSLYEKWFSSRASIITYGMYIDADLDRNTGIEGIDYNIYMSNGNSESKVKNLSNTWTKTFEQWSSILPLLKKSEKRVIHEENNYTAFFAAGKKFAQLSFDLSSIGSPDQFRILFYTIEKKYGTPWIFDFTNWINFPPPSMFISVQPENLELSPGDNKSLEIKLKSNAKFKPATQLDTLNLPSGIKADFANDKLDIPGFGEASTTMWIQAINATEGPHTITVITNSNIQKTSINAQEKTQANSSFIIPEMKKENFENFTTASSFIISVKPATELLQQIKDVLNEWQWLIAIAIGIIVDRFIPWDHIVSSIKKSKRN